MTTETCGTCGRAGRESLGFVCCTQRPAWERFAPSEACTFPVSRWIKLTDAIRAKRDAQAGIDQAVAAADRDLDGWSDLALEFVKRYAAGHRECRYIGHDIVEASKANGIAQPANPKAWGGPIQRAARAGVIKRVGFAEDPNRHNNPVPQWETV